MVLEQFHTCVEFLITLPWIHFLHVCIKCNKVLWSQFFKVCSSFLLQVSFGLTLFHRLLFMIYQLDSMMLRLGTRDIAGLWICWGCFHLGECSGLLSWFCSLFAMKDCHPLCFFSNQVCFECIDIMFGIIIIMKEIQNTTAWNAAPNQWLSLHRALQMHVDTHCWTSVLTSIKPGELLLGTDYNEVLQIHTKIFRWQMERKEKKLTKTLICGIFNRYMYE